MNTNLAARLGGWSARHRGMAVLCWLVFVAAAAVLGGVAGQQQLASYEYGAGDSAQAGRILAKAGIAAPAQELILVHSARPGEWQPAAAMVAAEVRATGQVSVLRPVLASRDRRDALVQFDLTGDPTTAADRIQPVLDVVNRVRAAYPSTRIDEYGDGSVTRYFNDSILVRPADRRLTV